MRAARYRITHYFTVVRNEFNESISELEVAATGRYAGWPLGTSRIPN